MSESHATNSFLSYCDPRGYPNVYHQNHLKPNEHYQEPSRIPSHYTDVGLYHFNPAPLTKSYPNDNNGYKKYEPKLDVFQSQPLRGNQDREYYLNLKLEPRSHSAPKHTYATILAYAILHTPEQKMTLDQIYTWVLDQFPYFETCDKDWRNSIRHNLSLNVMFERVPRQITELGKGSYWSCRPENAKKVENSNGSSPLARKRRSSRSKPPPFFPNEFNNSGLPNPSNFLTNYNSSNSLPEGYTPYLNQMSYPYSSLNPPSLSFHNSSSFSSYSPTHPHHPPPNPPSNTHYFPPTPISQNPPW